MEFYIDATDQIVGRLASRIAKILLNGDNVFVINAEKAIVSGKPRPTEQKYKEKVARGDPYHGPFYPRSPERILKRTVRGMLPYKQPKGRAAFKNLRVFVSVPKELENKKFERAENKLACKFATLSEICEKLTGKKY